jgi:hypothetical protein
MTFNQYHNAIDVEDHRVPITVPPGEGWDIVDPNEVMGTGQVRRNHNKKIMGRLLLVHGSWSNVIATESGRVLVGGLYAAVSTAIGLPLLVRYVPDDSAEAVLRSFGREYGEFNYENIKINQWHQASNQPSRHVGKGEAGQIAADPSAHLRSIIFTQDIMPRLSGGEAILDFGAGRGAYSALLRDRGWNAIDIEFYRRKKGSFAIDHNTVQRSIDRLCEFLAAGHLFDVTVADSVLNSVVTMEAQHHVMTILNRFCTPGGLIGCSGKSLDAYEHIFREEKEEAAYSLADHHQIGYFDKNGYSAGYSRGDWYIQKYHRLHEVHAIADTYIGDRFTLLYEGRRRPYPFEPFRGTPESFRSNRIWQLAGYKERHLADEELIAAVEYEFELPYKSGRTVGRSRDVLDALEQGGHLG